MGRFLFKLNSKSNLPKYEQIIRCVTEAILSKQLIRGQKLPSIKAISRQLAISCATVAKAYEELKRRGIVASTPYKGFHIASETVEHTLRIFLLFDELNPFKEDLYNAFKARLARKAVIDIFFHHYNIEVFRTLVLDNLGRYSHYVIMPFYHPRVADVLDAIDPQKVVILDQPGYVLDKYAFVGQDFENDVYACLKSISELVGKYKRLVLVYPEPNIHPKDIVHGVERFGREIGIETIVVGSIEQTLSEAKTAYIVIDDKILVNLIKMCKAKGLTIGGDVGIISYNDTPLKEILEGGITTVSTDFGQMGIGAAEHLLFARKEKKVNPARMIVRQSL